MMVMVFLFSVVGCSTSNQKAADDTKKQEVTQKEEQKQEPTKAEEKKTEVAKADGRSGKEPPPTKKKGPIKIGFCPTAMNTHYQVVINGVKQEIDAAGGKGFAELIIQAPSGQSAGAEQVNIVEGWIQQGIDAIAICTANDNAMESIFAKAAEKGIPVFEFNMPVVASTNPYYISNIGYDQKEAGKAIGEWMVKTFKDQPTNIAVLEGLPGVHNTERYGGFKEAIKDHANLKIVASQPADWARDKGQSVTENILSANSNIDVLWGIYDEMALGGLAAVKARGLLNKIKIVGYDNTPDACQAIKRKEMYATVDTAPKEMGRNIVRAIKKYVVDGEMVPKVMNSKVEVFDQTNIDKFDLSEYEYVKK